MDFLVDAQLPPGLAGWLIEIGNSAIRRRKSIDRSPLNCTGQHFSNGSTLTNCGQKRDCKGACIHQEVASPNARSLKLAFPPVEKGNIVKRLALTELQKPAVSKGCTRVEAVFYFLVGSKIGVGFGL